MKLCQTCGQSVAEEINICPACGGEVGEGREYIDDYRIAEVLHEGHASILCRAVKDGEEKPVMIRLFVSESGVDQEVADRLKRELEELKKLPADSFVSHQEIRRSSDGLWYRVSEWIDAESWGDLVRSGRLRDYRFAFDLFSKIASILDILHQAGHFIPHLILNDIMLVKREGEGLEVKIDYKLSRFLDPKLDRPGPMLKRLLECHPDIINERPLDYRSDIWSLGKIFVELLTADYETCDFLGKIDELPLPHDADVLFRTMLAEDPELRPRSMREVAETLNRITQADIEAAKKQQMEMAAASAGAIRRIKRRQAWLAATVVVLLVVVGAVWFQSNSRKKRNMAVLESYANQYARSVAFVAVEYCLREGKNVIYRNRSEGTAFLVDDEGHLLTNRHVACPWLEDSNVGPLIKQLRQSNRFPVFEYSMLLWFEGERAFKRSAGLVGSRELADTYVLSSAFRTDGAPRLSIAGVAKPPVQTRQLVTSPLKNDFAVLKIDRVPDGLTSLPLDLKLKPQRIPKLSQVITLGFPLGSRAQATSVNVSVTRGHVRRSFEDLLQIDASIYGGDSGGPVIDGRGKVIGIVSGVATDRTQGLIPMITPLWNMAMVLPINKVVKFLDELKTGQTKWNGILDPSVDIKLEGIIQAAGKGRWAEAMTLADEELKLSFDPSLVMAGGMMHFCAGDMKGARRLFGQSLSMDPENSLPRFMLFLTDWVRGERASDSHRMGLMRLDWRHPGEFFGFLFKVLDGQVPETAALKAWETEAEKSWLFYVVSLIREKRKAWKDAEKLLRQAVLSAESGAWEYFLARAKLDDVQKNRRDALKDEALWDTYRDEIHSFSQAVEKDLKAKEKRRAEFVALMTRFNEASARPSDKRQILENVFENAPRNGDVLAALAFYSAMEDAWEQALQYTQAFLKTEGRQSPRRLKMGLLEAEILHHMGREPAAVGSLERYGQLVKDPWYRGISECLLGKRSRDALKQAAGMNSENLLTLHVALGIWAEGSGERERAIEDYKEALESLLDTWIEFEFAKERIRSLRRDQ